MTLVANLDVSMGVNIAPLQRGLKRADTALQRFTGRITTNLVGQLTSVAAGFLSVRAAVNLLTQSMARLNETATRLDGVAKFADLIGVTGEELIALREAGGLVGGMDPRTVDMALQRMTRRIGEAANGVGELKDTLDDLELSSDEFFNAGTFRQIMMIGDALSELGTEGEQLARSFKFFDSEGARFGRVLALIYQDLQRFANRYSQIGLGLTDADLAAVESYNNAMRRLGDLVQRIADVLSISILPTLEAIVNVLTAWLYVWSIRFAATMRTTGQFLENLDKVAGFYGLDLGLGGKSPSQLLKDLNKALDQMLGLTAGDRLGEGVEDAATSKATSQIPKVAAAMEGSVEAAQALMEAQFAEQRGATADMLKVAKDSLTELKKIEKKTDTHTPVTLP